MPNHFVSPATLSLLEASAMSPYYCKISAFWWLLGDHCLADRARTTLIVFSLVSTCAQVAHASYHIPKTPVAKNLRKAASREKSFVKQAK